MKKLIISLVMFLAFATGLQAQNVSVSLTRNYMNGNTTWDTFFYYDIIHSRLTLPYSGRTHTLGINVEKSDIFLNFEMGLSNYGNLHLAKYNVNEGRDSDWNGNFLRHVSSSDLLFDNSDYKLNLGIVFDDISLFGSYYKYDSDFQMINGVLRVRPGIFGGLEILNKKFNSLNSTYILNYQAFGFGLTKSQDLLFGLIQLNGTFTYYPKFTIEGEGYWNIRDLIFRHKSKSGQQIVANFALVLKPIERLHVKFGYDFAKYWAKGETTKFGNVNLKKIENRWVINNEVKGFNWGLVYNF